MKQQNILELPIDNENFYKFLNFIETNKNFTFWYYLEITLAKNIILFTKNFNSKNLQFF